MHRKLPVRTLLAILAAGSLAVAQNQPKKPDKPASQTPAAKPASAPVKEAVKADPAILLQFGVTGLTKENEKAVKDSLTALSSQSYVCEACKVDKPVAGKCPKCSADLSMKKKPVLQGSAAMVDQSSLSVTVAPGSTLSYVELESALGKNSVHINPEKFTIPGRAELVLRGGTAETAPAIQKALDDAKLFDHVKATFDAAKAEIQVSVQAGAMAPTRAKLNSVIDASGTKLHLSDVLFGGAPKV